MQQLQEQAGALPQLQSELEVLQAAVQQLPDLQARVEGLREEVRGHELSITGGNGIEAERGVQAGS